MPCACLGRAFTVPLALSADEAVPSPSLFKSFVNCDTGSAGARVDEAVLQAAGVKNKIIRRLSPLMQVTC